MKGEKNDREKDILRKNGKKLYLEYLPEAILHFFVYLMTFTPLLVLILVPLTAIYQVGIKIGLFTAESLTEDIDLPESLSKPIVKKFSKDSSGRSYDLILYGATGFTGKLAAKYFAEKYGTSSISWAIAGRNEEKLKALKASLSQQSVSVGEKVGIVVADASDYEALTALAKLTKVVVTTAGPFGRYGEVLVRCCAENGTDYCDITAETNWVRNMIDKYQSIAMESGARIVPFCGHDCVPWDLSVLKCARAMQKRGEELIEVKAYDEYNGDISGGTVESLANILYDRDWTQGSDPLLRTNDQNQSSSPVSNQYQVYYQKVAFVQYDSIMKGWILPFLMSNVMANCLQRSNRLLQYSSRFIYQEAQLAANWFAAIISYERLALLLISFAFPPFHRLLKKKMLPQPGSGPSEAAMDQGFLRVRMNARGSKGSIVESMIYFPTDAGYRDTARMLVESGLTLAIEPNKVKVGGGFWTPASCQGEALLNRLIETGCTFEIKLQK